MSFCIDIETGPLGDEHLAMLKPEMEANRTLKDPLKIQADLLAKEAAWIEKAALSPLTGQILAIGLLGTNQPEGEQDLILDGDEASMLHKVWVLWGEGSRFFGFNVKWDFRFMAVRSWALGVPVPVDLMEGRYFNKRIVCLQEVVTFYSREISGFSLEATCAAFGLPGKLPGMTGADFARVFGEDRERAISYLRADLVATAALAARLGVQ